MTGIILKPRIGVMFVKLKCWLKIINNMGHVDHIDERGKSLPSVSSIPAIFAKDMSGFEDWICRGLHETEARCCTKAKREYYQEQADLGNDIHSLRESFLQGEAFTEGVPEYHAQVFEPIARFYKESGYKPLVLMGPTRNSGPLEAIELKMTGKEFGGTLDGAGTFSVPFWEKQRKTFWADDIGKLSRTFPGFEPLTTNDIVIEDLKIKSKLDPLHPLQLYGYSLLLKEVYGIHAMWGLIIRREKKLDKKPEIQLKGYYLPAYKEQWDAAMLMWRFLNA